MGCVIAYRMHGHHMCKCVPYARSCRVRSVHVSVHGDVCMDTLQSYTPICMYIVMYSYLSRIHHNRPPTFDVTYSHSAQWRCDGHVTPGLLPQRPCAACGRIPRTVGMQDSHEGGVIWLIQGDTLSHYSSRASLFHSARTSLLPHCRIWGLSAPLQCKLQNMWIFYFQKVHQNIWLTSCI